MNVNLSLSEGRVRLREFLRELIETVLLSLAVFLALHLSVQNFRVEGSSMVPTLTEGQYIVANKIIYSRVSTDSIAQFLPFLEPSGEGESLYTFHPPEYGDILIFHFPTDQSRDLVKRVIGLPGDTIEIQSGQVIRNGELVDEPYVVNRDRRSVDPIVVPENSYYVLGDNRRASSDSRDWGFLSDEHVVGRAWGSYWPTDRIGILQVFR